MSFTFIMTTRLPIPVAQITKLHRVRGTETTAVGRSSGKTFCWEFLEAVGEWRLQSYSSTGQVPRSARITAERHNRDVVVLRPAIRVTADVREQRFTKLIRLGRSVLYKLQQTVAAV